MVTLGIYVKIPGVMIRENCSFLRLEDVFFGGKSWDKQSLHLCVRLKDGVMEYKNVSIN